MRYFHGGFPGLRPGGLILPPDTTGTERRLSLHVTDSHDAPHAQRTDVVYMTTDRAIARGYAAFYPNGALYQVEPDGAPEPDPDCLMPGVSWQAPAARVLAIIDAVVLLNSRRAEKWMADIAGGVQ